MYAIKSIFMSVILSIFIIILLHYGYLLLKSSFTESKTKDVLGLSKKQYDSFKKTITEPTITEPIITEPTITEPANNTNKMEEELKNYIEDLKIKK